MSCKFTLHVVYRALPSDFRPTQPHSKVPEKDDEWPSLETILAFRDTVRTRLRSVYARLNSGELSKAGIPVRKVQRVLWMTYEHEAFHAEVCSDYTKTAQPN